MTRYFKFFLYIFIFSGTFLGVFCLFSGSSWAQELEPKIKDISLARTGDDLVVNLSLENPMSQEVYKALKSGIQIRLTFQIEIKEPGFPFDKTLMERNYTRLLKYDNLKKDYMVAAGPPSPKVVTVNSREEFECLAFHLDGAKVMPLRVLKEKKKYNFRVKAYLEIIEGSRPFEGLLKLFSSSKIETKWHELSFTY